MILEIKIIGKVPKTSVESMWINKTEWSIAQGMAGYRGPTQQKLKQAQLGVPHSEIQVELD